MAEQQSSLFKTVLYKANSVPLCPFGQLLLHGEQETVWFSLWDFVYLSPFGDGGDEQRCSHPLPSYTLRDPEHPWNSCRGASSGSNNKMEEQILCLLHNCGSEGYNMVHIYYVCVGHTNYIMHVNVMSYSQLLATEYA